MIISLIYAADEENGIAIDGRLPWHLRVDLKRFKALTMGHHVLMGRKTYQSIGMPLPGRTSIIVTRQQDYTPMVAGDAELFKINDPGELRQCEYQEALRRKDRTIFICPELEAGFEVARIRGDDELYVIGGGDIYAQSLPHAQKIYLTRVHVVSGCDVFAPEIMPGQWKVIETEYTPADAHNEHASTFQHLTRIQQAMNS